MNKKQVGDNLKLLQKRPEPGVDEQRWMQLEDAVRFLRDAVQGFVPLYVFSELHLYSVLVPVERLDGEFVEDILEWNMDAARIWSYSYTEGDGLEVVLHPPLSHTGSALLDGGEPIFSLREFPGVRAYAELSQRVSQLLGIHWMAERGAFCTLDENGDYADIASIQRDGDLLICSMDREYLDLYMLMTHTTLVRVFDVVRLAEGAPAEKSRDVKLYADRQAGIWARQGLAFGAQGEPVMGWLRGFQIIRRQITDAEALALITGEVPREYATFLVDDWKHKMVREWSCDPAQLANYFVKSDLPFETSLVFFSPEVLAKYKSDPDKYEVTMSWVACRGTWTLTYDLNEEGQVHVYLYYLSRLPYKEQLYWKSFNEAPKAGITLRTFKTDFLAQFDDSYDPLPSLAHLLGRFPPLVIAGQELPLWRPDPVSRKRLNYVVTDSRKEWEDAVLNLAKLLVDGLDEGNIRKLALRMGCDDPKLRSIKLLGKCLEAAGVDADVVKTVVSPLGELWDLRSQHGVAHRGTADVVDPRSDFRRLLEDCDRAMHTLADLITKGYLSSPGDHAADSCSHAQSHR
jgi:hypothetical protein